MKQIFVSSVHIETSPASDLVMRLRQEQFLVSHSPINDGSVNWGNWYEHDCFAELDKAEIFVSVITPSWEYSTWMQHEMIEALRRVEEGIMRRVCYYNPLNIEVRENYAEAYLKDRLPNDLNQVVQMMQSAD
ncbi:MAG TPA: hypothetical protein VGC91_04915 [Pyrinomonadaceae bacterium]|jgi:hypothetical protein